LSKLFKLKEWLTVPEAASHLTIIFGENITEADVFRLALDGKLMLSIFLPQTTLLKHAEFIPLSTQPEHLRAHLKCCGDSILSIQSDEIMHLNGIFELPMIEKERLIVEAEYYRAINGKVIEMIEGGTILIEQNKQLFSLQECFGDPTFVEYEEDDTEEQIFKKLAINSYCDAQRLPEEGTLIVRTDALRELEDSIKGTNEKPLSTTERHTLLTIIATLCDYSAIPYQERGAATQIARLTEEFGAPVSDDAIGKALKKIPDALDARSK